MTDQPTPNTLRDAVKRHLTIARNEPNNRDAAYECAARNAGRLIDALDAGAPFPDAWTPFYVSSDEHQPPNVGDDCNLCGTQRTDPNYYGPPQTDEPDPRSIAGQIREALAEWNALTEEDDDGDTFIDAGHDLARSAQALLDALAAPAQDEPDVAGLVADLGAARHTIQRLRDDRDQLRQRLDAATFTAQEHHDALEAIERLVRERDEARESLTYMNRAHRDALAAYNTATAARSRAEHQRDEARTALAATLATIDHATQQPTIDHHAAVLTHAAAIVHTTTTTGDRADLRRELKEHAHLHAAHLKQGRDVPGETRRLTACILALGMTTFGGDRKADDYADRLENRLRDAAAVLSR